MNYYIDTEFKEYYKQPKLFGYPMGKSIPTIDLISIGIVTDDNREYYALNKDCDLKEICKDKWLRENVLMPIWKENTIFKEEQNELDFNYKNLLYIFNKYGKTKKEIVKDIIAFVNIKEPVVFFGYYADYDWVVFCQLFGRMMDLPKGFPMYCVDLKQQLDEGIINFYIPKLLQNNGNKLVKFDDALKDVKNSLSYPKQVNEHNALSDAKWNKELRNCIIKVYGL